MEICHLKEGKEKKKKDHYIISSGIPGRRSIMDNVLGLVPKLIVAFSLQVISGIHGLTILIRQLWVTAVVHYLLFIQAQA